MARYTISWSQSADSSDSEIIWSLCPGRRAQWRPCTLRPEPLGQAAAWLETYRALWEARESLNLGPEEARLLELYRRMFVRAGAELEGAAAERLNIHPNTLRFRMKKLGVICPDGRGRSHRLSTDEADALTQA